MIKSGRHIRTGDFYLEVPTDDLERQNRYCVPCAEQWEDPPLSLLARNFNSSRMKTKRVTELMVRAEQQSKVMSLISWNMTYKEREEKEDQVKYEATKQSWEERLQSAREALGIQVSPKYPQKRKRRKE
jgi:hypothetical protein|tara:strand:+ start:10909 stop:11295 length:387 start_codon:yes stop_codon:yes gene_type:complete